MNTTDGAKAPISLPRALTAAQAAEHLGVTEAALAQMRWRNEGPDYIKFGRSVRYLPRDIERWWEEKTVGARPQHRPTKGRQ